MDSKLSDANELLARITDGDTGAVNAVLPAVYVELKRLASAYLARERTNHTLQPTALVHEAYMRLVDDAKADWRDRAHFFGIAANSMRQILINHAQKRKAAKRGGGGTQIAFDAALAIFEGPGIDILILDEALTTLSSLNPRFAKIVELRFFGGLNVKDVAQVLGISTRTVEREWMTARARLRQLIAED